MQFPAIKEDDSKYLMHAYGRFPAALVKGRNATAWDADGKKYIDFTAGIGVNCLGYSDSQWAAAVAAQAAQVQHISNLYYRLQSKPLKSSAPPAGWRVSFSAIAARKRTSVPLKLPANTARINTAQTAVKS